MVCELCESSVVSFNQHMKRNHPGCGRSANRQGYRSNGSYVDGWFGGECGSGNPYYLLCGSCREKYLALKSKSKASASDRYQKPERVALPRAGLGWMTGGFGQVEGLIVTHQVAREATQDTPTCTPRSPQEGLPRRGLSMCVACRRPSSSPLPLWLNRVRKQPWRAAPFLLAMATGGWEIPLTA